MLAASTVYNIFAVLHCVVCHTDKFAFSLAFAESIFRKSILKITKYLKKVFWKYKIKYTDKSILKIQNKILFGIFKIKYYFENTILHITDLVESKWSTTQLYSTVNSVQSDEKWLIKINVFNECYFFVFYKY